MRDLREPRIWRVLVRCAGVLLTAFLATHHVSAEPRGHYAFRTYASGDGLDNQSTMYVHQDSKGFVWVATEDGLFRAEGERFRRFDEADGLTIPLSRVLFTDDRGDLWVGGQGGVARFVGGRFEIYDAARGVPDAEVAFLVQPRDGPIWIATKQGPYRLTAAGRFEAVAGFRSGDCRAVSASPTSARVWVTTLTPGSEPRAHILSYENGGFREWQLEVPSAETIGEVVEDPSGRIWARGRSALWLLERGEQTFKRAYTLPVTEGLSRMTLDLQGNPLIPTQAGVHWLRGSTFQTIGTNEGLPTEWARHVMMDREGTLWIAGMGLHRMLGRGLIKSFTIKDGVPSNMAWAVQRDSKGRLWVGTNRGLAEQVGDGWQRTPGTEEYTINAVQEAPDGKVLFSGTPPRIWTWDPETRQLKTLSTSIPSTDYVFRLLVEPSGTIWAATKTAGLWRGSYADAPLELTRETLPLGTPDEMFINVSQGLNGRVWASGRRGLALYSEGKWQRFTTKEGLLGEHVAMTRELRSGEVVVAYTQARQTSHFRYEGGKLRLLQHEPWVERLSSVYAIGEDRRGQLWIGTGSGIYVRTARGVDRFTARDGVPSEDINNSSFWDDGNGDLWFATSGGFARFDGARYQGPVTPPDVWLTNATLGSQLLDPGQLPEAPHNDSSLFARFASSSYAGDDSTEYQVKLSSSGQDYETTLSQELHYATLPAGEHTLSVRARVGLGAWGKPTELSFRVLPAWYQTWPARGAGVLVLAVLGWVGVRVRTRALRRKNRALEAIVAARTHELREASFTDPLTSLRNRRFLSEEFAAASAKRQGTSSLPPIDTAPDAPDGAFVLLDIDHFKSINDRFGHRAGDQVLKQLSAILRASVREGDAVLRWGGEEFLILLRNTPRDSIALFAERLRASVEAHAFDIGSGTSVRSTISLGFAPWPFFPEARAAVGWEQVVSLADECLYVAKRCGRNRWVGVVPPVADRDVRPWPIQLEELIEAGSNWVVRRPIEDRPVDERRFSSWPIRSRLASQ